jgi:hypothetical protein
MPLLWVLSGRALCTFCLWGTATHDIIFPTMTINISSISS